MATKSTALTAADRVSALLGDDGQTWTASDGRSFAQLVEDYAGDVVWRDGWRTGDTYRVVFPDLSVLTVSGEAWDHGYRHCFCWRGTGHDHNDGYTNQEA